MAEASIDIRVFPNKEMTSVDFAEMMDAAIPNTGVIQGCGVTLENGVFNIGSGRLVVKGRLGVVTGGTIPNPTTLSRQETCWLLAVCNLNDETRPFYFLVATGDDLDRLGLSTEDEHPDFNITNGVDALTFGDCKVDPATGLATEYHAYGQATARKGWDWITYIEQQIRAHETEVNNKLTWKSLQGNDFKGTGFHAIPADAKEIYVALWVKWDTRQKVSLGFHVPVEDSLFVTSAEIMGHTNHWTKTNDGFVKLRFVKNTEGRFVAILNVYSGDSDVTNNTYWRILYR